MEIKNRIINYWSRRSGDFARLRRDELNSYMADLWLEEIRKYMPDKPCRILDIGTGSGFLPFCWEKPVIMWKVST